LQDDDDDEGDGHMRRKRQKKAAEEEEQKKVVAALPPCTDAQYVAKLLEVFPELVVHKRHLEKCAAIWRLVDEKKDELDLAALTGGQVKNVPFVSAMDPDCVEDRFTFVEGAVETLCREKLEELHAVAASKKKVFVWGTSGGGKSHLMNAFAFLKFSEHVLDSAKPRVLWFPDLGEFAKAMVTSFFQALVLAFFDCPLLLKEISPLLEDLQGLKRFASRYEVDLIADNNNVLHQDSLKSTVPPHLRTEATAFLCAWTVGSPHRLCYCASANQRSVGLAAGVQDGGITKFPVFGGWSILELQTYFHAKFPAIQRAEEVYKDAKAAATADPSKIEAAERSKVVWESKDGEDVCEVTGRIPMDVNNFLRSYTKELAIGSADFSESLGRWKTNKAGEIKLHFRGFFAKREKDFTATQLEDCWQLLKPGSFGETREVVNPNLVNCSFVYPGVTPDGQLDWSVLRPVSIVVEMVAMELWIAHEFEGKRDWRELLQDLLPARLNPSMKGFVDEKIVLTILTRVKISIKAARPDNEELAIDIDVDKTILFSGQWRRPKAGRPKLVVPTLATDMKKAFENAKCVQCLPLLWNYAQADDVLLCPTKTKPAMVEVQVTYEDPSNAAKATKTAKFFESHWKKFSVAPDEQWSKVLLWMSPSSKLRTLADATIYQAHLSFEDVFAAGDIEYS
jgi:hypothetical protein